MEELGLITQVVMGAVMGVGFLVLTLLGIKGRGNAGTMMTALDALRLDLEEEKKTAARQSEEIAKLQMGLTVAQSEYKAIHVQYEALQDKYSDVLERLNEQASEIKKLKQQYEEERNARVKAEKQREEAMTNLAVVVAERNAYQVAAQRPIRIELVSDQIKVSQPDSPDDDPTPSGGGPGGGDKPPANTVDFVEAVGKPLPEKKKDDKSSGEKAA